MRGRVLGTTVALCAFVAPASAAAAPQWLTPINHRVDPVYADDGDLDTAVSPGGYGIVVWPESDPLPDDDPGTSAIVVKAVVRAPGELASAPITVSDGALVANGQLAKDPKVAMDSDGTAVVVWAQGTSGGSNDQILTRTRSPNGTWGPITPASAENGGAAYSQRLALRNGRLALTWGGPANTVHGSVGTPSAPGIPSQLSTSGRANTPDVAIDDAGDAAFVWARTTNTSDRSVIETRVRPAGGALSGITTLTPDIAMHFVGPPDVEMEPTGRTIVVFGYQPPSGLVDRQIQYSTRSLSNGSFTAGTWAAAPDRASAIGIPADYPARVALGPDGTAVVAYRVQANNVIRTAYRPSGQGFIGDQPVSGTGAIFPTLAAGGDGSFVLASARGPNVLATIRAPGQTQFGVTKEDVDNSGSADTYGTVAVGVDSEGNALLGTQTSRSAGFTSYSSFRTVVYDNAAPRLSGVAIPGAGTTGTPVGFSAGATDQASPVSLSWNFGDGGTATGGSVSHAYAAPGSYTVTVTATDQAGNAASQTATVLVSAPAPAPGGNNPPAAPAKITAATSGSFKAGSSYTTIKKLAIKNIPAGASVYIKCTGGKKLGCPFTKTKKLTFKKATKTKDLTAYFNVKNKKTKKTKVAKLKPKAKIEVGVSAPSVLGNYVSYAMQKKKRPKQTKGCLAVGSTKKTTCG